MFRRVPLSIIRSSFTVHSAMVYVIQVCRQLSSRSRSCSKAVYKSFSSILTLWCHTTSHWLHEFQTGLEGRSDQDRQLPYRISHLCAESRKSYKTIPIFSFCLRCKDRWITPTTEQTRYSERRIWADRQISSLFVYLQDEKIHRNQSVFEITKMAGWAGSWTLPLILPWNRQMILTGWKRRKKNGGRDRLKESAIGNILHNRWRFETVEPLGKTSCLVSVFGVLYLQLGYINDTTRQKKKIIKKNPL
jgi:hypothetical protein